MDTIIAQKRDISAKGKQLRQAGIVPCVIYGAGLAESISIQIDRNAAGKLKHSRHNGSKVNIQIDEKTYPSLIKDMEYRRNHDEVVHISFIVLDAAKKQNSVVDINLINKDKVKGVLEQLQMQVPYAALPEYLLDSVTIDLETLPIGTSITIGDIPEFQSDKIDLQADAGNLVLRINNAILPEVVAAE